MPALLCRSRMPKPDDRELVQLFCGAIRQGHSIATAATNAGIGEMTARDWLKQGDEDLAAVQAATEPTEPSSLASFAWAVKQAEAHFVSGNLGVVNKAKRGDKGWLPAMTLLERRRPQDFGRFQRVEVEQRTLTVSITAQLPPGAAEALLAMARDEQAEGAKFLPPGPQDSDSA